MEYLLHLLGFKKTDRLFKGQPKTKVVKWESYLLTLAKLLLVLRITQEPILLLMEA
jgi:hypothetical protein